MYYIEKANKVLGIDGNNVVEEDKKTSKGELVENINVEFRVGSNIVFFLLYSSMTLPLALLRI